MANALHVSNSEIFAKHQANIAASLAHRLEVARATHNTQLIALLEREQKQVLSPSMAERAVSLVSAFKSMVHRAIKVLTPASQLIVEQVSDPGGQVWWYAFDPRTGKTLYAETESEIVTWIEDNRLGQ